MSNTKYGNSALQNVTTGVENSAFGEECMRDLLTSAKNTGVGFQALQRNIDGGSNTAIGRQALYANQSGNANIAIGNTALYLNNASGNIAIGDKALHRNIDGTKNIAIGISCMTNNNAGTENTAVGQRAMLNSSNNSKNCAFGVSVLSEAYFEGDGNSAFGWNSLSDLKIGSTNSAFGARALGGLLQGEANIALGERSGITLQEGDGNILIGNQGVRTESKTIRIGEEQDRAFLAGVYSGSSAAGGGVPVYVDNAGQLFTPFMPPSSTAVSNAVDLGESNVDLRDLRPVKFPHVKGENERSETLQFGLIAEEVDRVFPDLVVHDNEGKPTDIKYQELPVLLLNEVLRQAKIIDNLMLEISKLRE